MSRYNVNFRDVVNAVTWFYLRTARTLSLLFSLIKSLQTLNNDGVVVEALGQDSPSFFQLVRHIQKFVIFDARTLYLQKYLNDIYDPVLKRIVIVNDNTSHVIYIFNLAETTDSTIFYLYNSWDATVAYKQGSAPPAETDADFVLNDFDNHIYHAILTAGNTNKRPDLNPLHWVDDGLITFLFNNEDSFPVDYRIDIPLSVTLQPDYSNARIQSQINLLNLAGRTYNGVELGNVTNVFFTNIE